MGRGDQLGTQFLLLHSHNRVLTLCLQTQQTTDSAGDTSWVPTQFNSNIIYLEDPVSKTTLPPTLDVNHKPQVVLPVLLMYWL